MRFAIPTVAAAVWLAGLGTGCQGNGGAVSVRWHIVDLSTGQLIDPGDRAQPDGSCVQTEPDMSVLRPWTINSIDLVIANPLTGLEEPPPCAAGGCLTFKCAQTEATTPFSLPLGTFALSLRAISPPDTKTVTPAPAVRTIKRAEVVNLDVVEIGVHPPPLAAVVDGGTEPQDLSVTDAAQ